MTLDLREEFRRAVVEPFVRGYARGETPNPCIRCNGGFRFAELLAFAARVGAARLATGHYARIVERDGRLLLARAADPRKDQSYMLARLDPRRLGALWFPLGDADEGRDARGGGRGRARGGAARREPGGVLPRRRRLPARSWSGRARRARRARSSTRRARARQRTTASGASRPASAAGSASRRPSRCMRSRTNAAHEHRRRRAARGARAARAPRRGRLYAPGTASRRSCATARPRSAASVERRRTVPAPARRARLRRRARPGRRALRRRRGGRFRVGHVARGRLGFQPCDRLSPTETLADLGARGLPRRGRARPRLGVLAPGRNVRPPLLVDRGAESGSCR